MPLYGNMHHHSENKLAKNSERESDQFSELPNRKKYKERKSCSRQWRNAIIKPQNVGNYRKNNLDLQQKISENLKR